MTARWRPALAAVVLAVLAAAFVVWINSYRAAVPTWQLLPDDRGRIAHVACLVNSARRAALRNAALVTRILNALPKRTRLTVLTNDPRAFAVVGDPQRGRLEIIDLPPKSDFTIWPQDPFLVIACRDGRRVLLASREFDRVDDRLIPERLARHLRIAHRRSKLSFEGGNIVSGSRHVFIGANTIRYNAWKLRKTDAEIVRELQRELGRPVLVIGPLPQPVDHIDMMMTALGGGDVAVADARWGARLARKELRRDAGSVRAFERRCEEYYFGDPRIRSLRDVKGGLIKPPKVMGDTARAVKDSEAIAAKLDGIAEELGRWGYRVHRFPFLIRSSRPDAKGLGRKPAAKPKAPEPEPTYPCLTYNNVLIEGDSARRTVYLPQYGFAPLDMAAKNAWRKLGFRVVTVPGFTTSAMYGGSLRCCAKVLERDWSARRE